MPLHDEMATRARTVEFGPVQIPILSPEDLIICKAVFGRPKDWVDIESMIGWGTEVDRSVVALWIDEILGTSSPTLARLEELLTDS